MPDPLRLLVCEYLEAEVTAVLAGLQAPEVALETFAGRCGRPLTAEAMPETCRGNGPLVVLAGLCAPGGCSRAPGTPLGSGCCLELLVGAEQYHTWTRRGDHLLAPGMLARWRENLEEDGFDRDTARAFYRDSTRCLRLLDTGTDPEAARRLQEFSAFLDVPARTEAVGLELLERRIRDRLAQAEQAIPSPHADGLSAESRVADYALLAEISSELASTLDQGQVIRHVLELLEVLCAPQSVHFLPLSGSQAGELHSAPAASLEPELREAMEGLDQEFVITEEADGFFILIERQDQRQGVLAVREVAFPDKLRHYLNLALLIAPVLSLALNNARTYQMLQDTEQRHSSVLESSLDAILGLDEDNRVLTLNRAALQMFECEATGIIGEAVSTLFRAEDGELLLEALRAARHGERTGHLIELEARRAGGDGFPVEASYSLDRSDRRGTATLVLRDISARRLADQLLKDSKMELERRVEERTEELLSLEQKYEDLYDQAPDMFVSVDAETAAIVECNQTLCDKLGYSKEEIRGQPIFMVYHEDCMDAVQRAFESFVQTGEVNNAELILKRRDGSKIDVILNVSAVRDADGKILHSRSSWRDVSQLKEEARRRKKAESQLRQAQKMETIGVLAGGLAHDFNNILTAILGYSELLEARAGLEGESRLFLTEIENAGRSAAALTRQLLAFSRKQVLNPQPIPPNQVLLQVCEMAGRLIGEHIRLDTELDPEAGNVLVDPSHFEQVILNPVVNAKDAMPEGGTLRLSTANLEVDASLCSRYPELKPGPYVRISIADDGVGMDEETRSRICEPVFTTKPKGERSGPGLSTTYGIVRQSGGMIEVYSEPGIGTTFKIFLPQTGAEAAEPLPRPEASPGGTERILVLEDEERLRKLTDQLLGSAGYQVHLAADSTEAMELARSYGPFDLILSDVVLPGVSGPRAAKQLLELHPGTRLLFMSGYAPDLRGLQEELTVGQTILEKPFSSQELLRQVRSRLDEPEPQPEALSDA